MSERECLTRAETVWTERSTFEHISGEQMHALFMLFLLVNLFLLGQLPLTSLIVSLGSVYLKQRFHLCSHRSSF